MSARSISSAFPFESKFVHVNGVRMHYVEQGAGQPIVFIHGLPVHSYVWRNVLPHVAKVGRCIAIDLYGFGKSDQPTQPVDYRTHADMVAGVINALGLTKIILVVMDWGSPMGFQYAHDHPDNVRGIAFWEALVRPITPTTAEASTRALFKVLKTSVGGHLLVQRANILLNILLGQLVSRKLSAEEKAAYHAPFATYNSRYAMRAVVGALPVDGFPKAAHDSMQAYSDWLCTTTDLPKLMLVASKPLVGKPQFVAWTAEHFPNLKVVELEGAHFLQENAPDKAPTLEPLEQPDPEPMSFDQTLHVGKSSHPYRKSGRALTVASSRAEPSHLGLGKRAKHSK